MRHVYVTAVGIIVAGLILASVLYALHKPVDLETFLMPYQTEWSQLKLDSLHQSLNQEDLWDSERQFYMKFVVSDPAYNHLSCQQQTEAWEQFAGITFYTPRYPDFPTKIGWAWQDSKKGLPVLGIFVSATGFAALALAGFIQSLSWLRPPAVIWIHVVPCFIAAAFLIHGSAGHYYWASDDYYQMLRLVTTAVATLCCYRAMGWRRRWAVWMFAGIAVFFNPFLLAEISSEILHVILIATAILIIAGSVCLLPADRQVRWGWQRKTYMVLLVGMAAFISSGMLADELWGLWGW